MNEPLWMPAGSVRALMALAILAAALFMWVTGREMTQAQELLTASAVGGYFVVKQLNSGVFPPKGGPPQDLLRGPD